MNNELRTLQNFTTVLQPSYSIDGPDNHDPDWEESSSSNENEDSELE